MSPFGSKSLPCASAQSKLTTILATSEGRHLVSFWFEFDHLLFWTILNHWKWSAGLFLALVSGQPQSMEELDCFTFLLARHLADVLRYVVSGYSTVRSGTLTWREWGLWDRPRPLNLYGIPYSSQRHLSAISFTRDAPPETGVPRGRGGAVSSVGSPFRPSPVLLSRMYEVNRRLFVHFPNFFLN